MCVGVPTEGHLEPGVASLRSSKSRRIDQIPKLFVENSEDQAKAGYSRVSSYGRLKLSNVLTPLFTALRMKMEARGIPEASSGC